MIKLNIFNQFQKNRDKLLKNKEYLSILIYFTLFFIIDYFSTIDIYGQSMIRRLINMYRRIDPLNYEKKLKPFCEKYDKILDKNDILNLKSKKGDSLPTHTLRFWEKEFKQIKPKILTGNRRYYDKKNIELLKKIHFLLKDRKSVV